jgi:hypothetical protein
MLRSRLSLEPLDARIVPSGTPATPPDTPVQYGEPTPGDDYADAKATPQVQLEFSGVTTGKAYTLVIRVNFADGTIGEGIVINITSEATANNIAAAVASGLNGYKVNGTSVIEATVDANGTGVTFRGKNGMQVSAVFVSTLGGPNLTPPTLVSTSPGVEVEIKK